MGCVDLSKAEDALRDPMMVVSRMGCVDLSILISQIRENGFCLIPHGMRQAIDFAYLVDVLTFSRINRII